MMTQYMRIIVIACSLLIMECQGVYGAQLSENESEVRKNASELMEAFNQHDPNKIASLWAKDAVMYHPLTGETSHGRDEIVQYYKNRFEKESDSRVEIIIDNIEFDGSDSAVEHGVFRVSYKDKPSIQSAFRANLVKENGKWVMNEIADIAIESAPSQFEHLKEIDWLVGNWVDRDENIEITFNCKWDKYKNFLTQHFSTKVLGQNQLEGQQLIAWDPIKEKIRSWVFDSDGGFGEGFWTKAENSWYAAMSYTLSDGQKASATLVYTKIDDNSYKFASIGRDINGEVLPDLNPVTVERAP